VISAVVLCIQTMMKHSGNRRRITERDEELLFQNTVYTKLQSRIVETVEEQKIDPQLAHTAEERHINADNPYQKQPIVVPQSSKRAVDSNDTISSSTAIASDDNNKPAQVDLVKQLLEPLKKEEEKQIVNTNGGNTIGILTEQQNNVPSTLTVNNNIIQQRIERESEWDNEKEKNEDIRKTDNEPSSPLVNQENKPVIQPKPDIDNSNVELMGDKYILFLPSRDEGLNSYLLSYIIMARLSLKYSRILLLPKAPQNKQAGQIANNIKELLGAKTLNSNAITFKTLFKTTSRYEEINRHPTLLSLYKLGLIPVCEVNTDSSQIQSARDELSKCMTKNMNSKYVIVTSPFSLGSFEGPSLKSYFDISSKVSLASTRLLSDTGIDSKSYLVGYIRSNCKPKECNIKNELSQVQNKQTQLSLKSVVIITDDPNNAEIEAYIKDNHLNASWYISSDIIKKPNLVLPASWKQDITTCTVLEMGMAVHAPYFMGNRSSTFSMNIQMLRVQHSKADHTTILLDDN
jgi:hypothetical protein